MKFFSRLLCAMPGLLCLSIGGCGGPVASNTAPVITGFLPQGGFIGTTTAVTLTGRNFAAGALVTVGPDPGITVTQANVVSATRVNATFVIAADATQARRSITITNPNGESYEYASAFSVSGLSPVTVTSMAPTTGARGGTVNVTITGSNFQAEATVSGGTGMTFNNLNVVSSTTITAQLVIGAGATTGLQNIIVQNPNGYGAGGIGVFTVTQ